MSDPYYIRFIEMAGTLDVGSPPKRGAYLAAYDPDHYNGRGEAHWTDDVNLAVRFDRISDAIACYQQVSMLRPRRKDGKPNRPLTSVTVTVTQSTEDV